jgi:hypothetical protein
VLDAVEPIFERFIGIICEERKNDGQPGALMDAAL